MSVYESPTPRGGGVTVAAALMAAVTLVGLSTRPLMAIDETRYAAVALEMLQRGDWLVPHLNGETYSHKPPMLFWLVLAGWKVFGVSAVWARMVAPLAGIVALGLVASLARRLWPHDARTRGWAPLVVVGAALWALFGGLFMFDTLLACSALIGVIGIVSAVQHQSRYGLIWIAAGTTLGILSKGPVILLHLLPVALLAPWWATPREDRHWRHWYVGLAGALLLGAAGALLWAIPAGIAGGPEYQREIFLGQTAGRVSNSFAHRRAVWWYLPLLPAVLFPWIVWPEAWRAMGALRAAPRDAGVRFCAAWAGSGLLAFSLVSGKQVHYLLPLIPAVALLLARGLSLREAAPLHRPWLVAIGVSIISGAVIVAANTTWLTGVLWWPHGAIHWWWAVLPIVSAVLLLVWQRGRSTRNAAVHAVAVAMAVLLCSIHLAAGRAGTLPYDTAPMASAIRSALAAGHPIAMIGRYNGEYHFEGRLRGVHFDVLTPQSAPAWLRANREGLLLRYDRSRQAPAIAGTVAQHPFRNGWATLAASAPAGTIRPEPDATDDPVSPAVR